jgi:hypothetical protein
MSNTTSRRPYSSGPNSTRQQIIRYFRENPDARPVDVARKFKYSPGATHGCKKIALAAMSDTQTNGTFKNGSGWSNTDLHSALVGPAQMSSDDLYTLTQGRSKNVVTPPPSLFSWADYSLWMDREQMRGFLRGRAVEYLTKGDKLSIEEALRCVTKLNELTD